MTDTVETKVEDQEKPVEKQKPEWTPEELAAVFDDILFEGEYVETMTIKKKLQVTFKTRTAEETIETSKLIDAKQFNLITTVQEHRALYNLYASLIQYGSKDLKEMKPEDKRMFINKLNIQVISALSDALGKFDRKVEKACSEAETNF